MTSGGFGKGRIRRGGGNWRDRSDRDRALTRNTETTEKSIQDHKDASESGLMQSDFELRLSQQDLDFSNTVIVEIRCNGFVCQQARFIGSSLNDVLLKDADLRGCDFKSSELVGCIFDDVDLEYSNFDNTSASGLIIKNGNLKSSKLINADLSACEFEDVDFNGASFDNSNLKSTKFKDVSLANVSFNDCNLSEVSFHEVYFDHTDFSDTDVSGVQLKNCEGNIILNGEICSPEQLI